MQQLDTLMLFGTASLSCGFLDALLPVFTAACDHGLIWLVTGAVLLLGRKTRRTGWMLLLSVALIYIVGDTILKELVMRPRPFVRFEDAALLIPPPSGSSFPSGHTSSSFAALSVLYARLPASRVPASVFALLIAFSRVYLFVHFPFDVLTGALLGIACAALVLSIFRKTTPPVPLY